MEISSSQQEIIDRLKRRGAQSVKILSKQLDMTSMGVRQHLQYLAKKGLVKQTLPEKQTRGRPVHLWELSMLGHERYPDSHAKVTTELIDAVNQVYGSAGMNALVAEMSKSVQFQYTEAEIQPNASLSERLKILADLRIADGYMAEVRLLPDGWLFIENHCPICSAAKKCSALCDAEFSVFRAVLGNKVSIIRTEHLLNGARRCAYKITEA